MSSQIFETYKHSGKYDIKGPVTAVVAGAVVAFIMGYLYAYLVRLIPFIYINFLATMGYGFVFGTLTAMLMQWAKVRNTGVAVLSGLLVGLLAWYFAWSAYVHAAFDGAPVILWPGDLPSVLGQLYKQGSWSLKGATVSGIPLAIVWLVEGGIILGFSVAVPFGLISDTPFCETSQCWLDEEKKIDTLATFADTAQLTALKAGDLGPLLQAQPRNADSMEFARLKIKQSAKAQTFCTVRIENITLQRDSEGKVTEKVKELTGNLMLPHTMAGLITKFEKFGEPPAAPAEPPAPEAPAA